MATSAVNSMVLLATPSTGNARTLAVPTGFVDSLNHAIRREDVPATRREQRPAVESDQPVRSTEEQSAPADETNVEQDAANTEPETSPPTRTDEGSSDQQPEDEQPKDETESDVVAISEQAAQQAAVVAQNVASDGEAVVEQAGESTAEPTSTLPTDQTPVDAKPSTTPGEIAQDLSDATEAAASTANSSEVLEEGALATQAALASDQQKAGNKSKEVASAAKLKTPSESSSDSEPQETQLSAVSADDGAKLPQEATPVPAADAPTAGVDQESGPANRQSSSKVEPNSPPEAQSTPPDIERDGLKLHAEGEATNTDPKDRPAPATNNFQSVLDRASSLASRRTTPTELPSHHPPEVDAQRFISRVSRAFQVAETRGGPLQLRLSPPELGALKIELSIQQGTLTAKLETETAAAKSVLLDNLPALRERLAAQEIRVDKFEVDVRQQNSGEQPNWQAQQDGQDARQARTAATSRRLSAQQTTETPGPEQTTDTRTNHDGQFSAVA